MKAAMEGDPGHGVEIQNAAAERLSKAHLPAQNGGGVVVVFGLQEHPF